jgi:hypothetical protein
MAANANVNFKLKLEAQELKAQEKLVENPIPLTPKQRLEKLAHEVFEGHEEYLGLTPD